MDWRSAYSNPRAWVSSLAGATIALTFVGIACGPSGGSTFGPDDGGLEGGDLGDSPGCLTGNTVCSGNVAVDCKTGAQTDCGPDKTCATGLGCVVCVPGAGTCSNGAAHTCRADGSGYEDYECDPVQGMTCAPDGCKGVCAPAELQKSYIGCEYWPTVTLNPVWSGFSFAVLIASASDEAATVTITRGATAISTVQLAPHASQTLTLPWVAELKGPDVDGCENPQEPGATRVVAGGAYRLRSNKPITAYQLSPLTYKTDPVPVGCPGTTATCAGSVVTECLSFSNDASLLIPTNTLTRDYPAIAWPSTSNRSSFIAITAVQDGTDVSLTGAVGAIAAGAGIDATGAGKVTLARGDVLEIIAQHPAGAGYGADLSGTNIQSSRPIQVVAGQSCANIPTADTGTCDHVEEIMFPHEALAADYLVTYARADVGDPGPQVIRVASVVPGTNVHFDPPIAADAAVDPKAPLQILNVTRDVHITADHPILVAQYLPGKQALPSPSASGDPSQSLAIPTAQFRTQYVFVASTTYFANFVNVIAPQGTDVTLDGASIPSSEFSPIGASGFSVARHELAKTGDIHTIQAAKAFGIVVYGYGKDTSYMYPGGLDLKALQPPPPR